MKLSERVHTVYKATGVGDMVYIGMTSKPVRYRATEHRADADRGKKTPFHEAIRWNGFESFVFVEVAQCKNRKDAHLVERELIAIEMAYRSNKLLNTFEVAGTQPNQRLTAEHRAAISKSKSGKLHPRYIDTIFTFKHIEHGTVDCTMFEMKNRFALDSRHIHSLCTGKPGFRSVKGWSVVKSIKPTKGDL